MTNKTKNIQIGCAGTVLIAILCGVIITFYLFEASIYDVTMAAFSVDGVYDVHGINLSDNSEYVYVDTCITGNADTIAQQVTNAVRELNGMDDKQIFVTTTDTAITRQYHEGVFLSEEARAFC
jgi:hypothetical protein